MLESVPGGFALDERHQPHITTLQRYVHRSQNRIESCHQLRSAIAQVGGTVSRVLWGVVSDRSFGGRRRPGVVASAAIGAAAYAMLALGSSLPEWLAYPLAFVAGAGAFGWVGLYFALVAEIGGPRHAGLLTGAATACSWSGTLIGPPIFGLVLEATGGYTASWLILTAVGLAVVLTLPRLSPLVQRG